jgi:hypothetical protein
MKEQRHSASAPANASVSVARGLFTDDFSQPKESDAPIETSVTMTGPNFGLSWWRHACCNH